MLFAISPGRFFAVNEAKAVLAHIVATYDIKLEDGKGAPRQFWFSGTLFTRPGNVMFRARQK
jgi:cytochrome P450